jgi:streptogramin lyase
LTEILVCCVGTVWYARNIAESITKIVGRDRVSDTTKTIPEWSATHASRRASITSIGNRIGELTTGASRSARMRTIYAEEGLTFIRNNASSSSWVGIVDQWATG